MGKLNAGNDAEKLDKSSIADGNVIWYSHSGKQFGGCFKKNLNTHYWALTLTKQNTSAKRLHTVIHCFFSNTWKWKQSKWLSVGEYLNKLLYPYYSAMKRKELLIYIYKKTLWIDIKGIVLIKKSQSQEIVTVYVWFHLYITYLKWQSYRDREQISCFLGFIKGAERGEEREQKKCSLFWE